MKVQLFFAIVSLIQFSFAFEESLYPHRKHESLSNETLLCLDIKKRLFHSTRVTDLQRLEWERFLPVFVKTQVFDLQKNRQSSGNHEMEFTNDYDHGRFHVLGPIGPTCRTPIEQYGVGDDEKRACGLQQLQQINQAATEQGRSHECVIYSLGSGGTWGFEEEVLKKTNCRVETFDCTMHKNYDAPPALRHRVRFHAICLSSSDYELNGRKFVSWPTLNKITGIANQPTFLKMDIEGYEFPVMKSIIDSGVMLPLQIAMEVHYERTIGGIIDFRKANSLEVYSFANYLYKFGGYYLIDRHDNVACKHCTEVVFAKLNCENHPRPDNFREILLSSEGIEHDGFKKSLKQSLDAEYYK